MVVEEERKEALLRALANDFSRRIILSTVPAAKSVEEIAKVSGIPLSSCYRKIRGLLSSKILRVEKTIITVDGKKYEMLRSTVKSAVFSLSSSGELSVEVNLLPKEPDERLSKMWSVVRMKESQPVVQIPAAVS